MAMNDWMGQLSDNLCLYEITMPGSHDAGVYAGDAVSTGGAPLHLSICQSQGIGGQCADGSRFFDIRLKMDGKVSKAYHQTLGMGALGGSGAKMLQEVKSFLQSNASEVVILRISHTSTSTGIVSQVKNLLGSTLYKGRGNISKLKLGTVRGKAICVFDTKKFVSDVNPTQGIHAFRKHSGGGGTGEGLTTCGVYANKSSIRSVIADQLQKADTHSTHAQNDHLFVMYWTQTGGNVHAHTTKRIDFGKSRRKHRATGGTHHNMDYMIHLLISGEDRYGEIRKGKWKVQPSTWQDRRDCMPNVIMYDFVNMRTSREIVYLNDPGVKAHLVDEAEEEQGQMIANLFG